MEKLSENEYFKNRKIAKGGFRGKIKLRKPCRRHTETRTGKTWKHYLRDSRALIGLSGSFMLLTALVYGLYGLPWGPAFYVLLLDIVILLTVLAAGYGSYCRKLQALRDTANHPEYTLDGLPEPEDMAEAMYKIILEKIHGRLRVKAEAYDRSIWEARQYYTRWSHQVKTPIAGISLLLQEEELDRRELNRELYKIRQYVDMALQYQRLGGKADDLVLKEHELGTIVRQALKKTAVLFRHKDVALELGNLDCSLITDEKQLAFVIEQLVGNAAKYTKKGSVFLGLTTCQGKRELLIRDTGIGIRKEDLPRIFDWGYTGYNGRGDCHSTGIGLSLCRQTLELLGHEIRIESEPGKGTDVYIDLTQMKLEYD